MMVLHNEELRYLYFLVVVDALHRALPMDCACINEIRKQDMHTGHLGSLWEYSGGDRKMLLKSVLGLCCYELYGIGSGSVPASDFMLVALSLGVLPENIKPNTENVL
jgi:hypothetical protein